MAQGAQSPPLVWPGRDARSKPRVRGHSGSCATCSLLGRRGRVRPSLRKPRAARAQRRCALPDRASRSLSPAGSGERGYAMRKRPPARCRLASEAARSESIWRLHPCLRNCPSLPALTVLRGGLVSISRGPISQSSTLSKIRCAALVIAKIRCAIFCDRRVASCRRHA